jgi:hypothetical protein
MIVSGTHGQPSSIPHFVGANVLLIDVTALCCLCRCAELTSPAVSIHRHHADASPAKTSDAIDYTVGLSCSQSGTMRGTASPTVLSEASESGSQVYCRIFGGLLTG